MPHKHYLYALQTALTALIMQVKDLAEELRRLNPKCISLPGLSQILLMRICSL